MASIIKKIWKKSTDLFIENGRTFEQLAEVGQLFPLLVLFLTDPLQSLRQILDVRTEMFDRFQAILEVTDWKIKTTDMKKETTVNQIKSIS